MFVQLWQQPNGLSTLTIEELSDILVLDSAFVCDGGGGLRNGLDVVTLEDDLVLDVREGDLDTGCHGAFSNNLLSHYWSAQSYTETK